MYCPNCNQYMYSDGEICPYCGGQMIPDQVVQQQTYGESVPSQGYSENVYSYGAFYPQNGYMQEQNYDNNNVQQWNVNYGNMQYQQGIQPQQVMQSQQLPNHGKKTKGKLIAVISVLSVLIVAAVVVLCWQLNNNKTSVDSETNMVAGWYNRSDDIATAHAIKTAIEMAMGNENIYAWLATGEPRSDIYVTNGASDVKNITTVIRVIPGETEPQKAIIIDSIGKLENMTEEDVKTLIYSYIDDENGCPLLKYTGAADGVNAPTEYVVYISSKGTVFSGTGANGQMYYELRPEVCTEYQ